MNIQTGGIVDLVKEHIQILDPYAEVILLFPQGQGMHEDIQIYILTPEKVDFGLEQQYLNARYNIELESAHSFSIYIYTKEDWHKQFVNTPIYEQVDTEGIRL